MKAVYRNHFMHHRYDGTSNFNLVLGADILRRRVRMPRYMVASRWKSWKKPIGT